VAACYDDKGVMTMSEADQLQLIADKASLNTTVATMTTRIQELWRRSCTRPRGRRSVWRSAMPTTSSARTIAPLATQESLGCRMAPVRPLEISATCSSRLPFLSAAFVRTSSHARAVAPARTALRSGSVLLTGRCHARAACLTLDVGQDFFSALDFYFLFLFYFPSHAGDFSSHFSLSNHNITR
jgi:hypothetical protein